MESNKHFIVRDECLSYYNELKGKVNKTMGDHADMWWMEGGNLPFERKSPDFKVMYESWVEWSFPE